MKPAVPSAVPYPDMLSRQQLGVKLGDNVTADLRYANPRGTAESASTRAERG